MLLKSYKKYRKLLNKSKILLKKKQTKRIELHPASQLQKAC
jgi:hypothetical protein